MYRVTWLIRNRVASLIRNRQSWTLEVESASRVRASWRFPTRLDVLALLACACFGVVFKT
jgi:hypothetical protein